MLSKHKNILFAIIGIIIVFFGYWYFVLSKKPKETAGVSGTGLTVTTNSADASAPTTNSYDKEFVANLQTVRYIDLNATILTSAAFRAMSFPERPFEVDYDIPAGRRNPFLPIGVDARDTVVNAASQVQAVPNEPVAQDTQPVTTKAASSTTPVQPVKR
jgi:hypothetical protein